MPERKSSRKRRRQADRHIIVIFQQFLYFFNIVSNGFGVLRANRKTGTARNASFFDYLRLVIIHAYRLDGA
jgi:hypothetical protein